jgi:hypothetical protein
MSVPNIEARLTRCKITILILQVLFVVAKMQHQAVVFAATTNLPKNNLSLFCKTSGD